MYVRTSNGFVNSLGYARDPNDARRTPLSPREQYHKIETEIKAVRSGMRVACRGVR